MRRSLNRDRKGMSLHTLLHTKLNLSFKEWTKADKHQALVSTDQIHGPITSQRNLYPDTTRRAPDATAFESAHLLRLFPQSVP